VFYSNRKALKDNQGFKNNMAEGERGKTELLSVLPAVLPTSRTEQEL